MKYKITKVYKRWMDCEVEADSPEEALEAAKDAEWKWDNEGGYSFDCGSWTELDEDDIPLDEGEYTRDQLKPIMDIGENVTD